MKQQQPSQQAAGKNQPSTASKDSSFNKRADDSRRETGRSDMNNPASDRPERSQRDSNNPSSGQRPGNR